MNKIVTLSLLLGFSTMTLLAQTNPEHVIPTQKNLSEEFTKSLYDKSDYVFKGDELKTIGMPVGGIAAGQLYMGGDGQLWNWDIFNVPVSDPGGAGDRYYLNPLVQQEVFANGFGISVKRGAQLHQRRLNRDGFSQVSFDGQYPMATVRYSDPSMAVDVTLQGYSPFIPTDHEDSGLPLTVLEYTVTNTAAVEVEVELVGWMQNMSGFSGASSHSGEHVNRVSRGDGFTRLTLSTGDSLKNSCADWGDLSLTLLGDGVASAEAYQTVGLPLYFVGDEQTSATSALGDPLVGAVASRAVLKAGESRTFTFVVSWYYPNAHLNRASHHVMGLENLRHYYSSRFSSSAEVADYLIAHPELRVATKEWVNTWYDSSLEDWFLDRTFANVSTLATVASLRFDDLLDSPQNEGRFYTAEGVYLGEGTCTHVFHYEQALGRVFPALAGQLREQTDLGIAYQDGVIKYRGEFDFGQHDGRNYAVDGQAGTILRIYREHLSSLDDSFLRDNWSKIKGAMNYMISHDKEKTGVADGLLEGIQYNTLDRMWYGKIPWISGLYAAALRASAEMALAVGDKSFARECTRIADLSYENMSSELFDGEYFVQLTDPDHLDAPNSNRGCHVDQLLGQYWASQLSLGDIVPSDELKSALASILKYNFVDDYDAFLASTEIPIARWYADGDESGVIMCSFPKGGADLAPGKINNEWEKLVIGYFSEMWTGQEHALAAAMIDQGMISEAMQVEKALDDRYSADKRNPYNEVEYGNHYTRAMSGYAPFVSATGFFNDNPRGIMAFDPKVGADDFRAAFISAEGWGSYSQNLDNGHYSLELRYGTLRLNELQLPVTSSGNYTLTLNGQEIKAKYKLQDNCLSVILPQLQLSKSDKLTLTIN